MELLVNIYIVYKWIYVNCKLCKIFYNKVLGIKKIIINVLFMVSCFFECLCFL